MNLSLHSTINQVQPKCNRLTIGNRFSIAGEILVVTSLCLVIIQGLNGYQGWGNWLLVPGVLVGAAVAATLAFHRPFNSLGFNTNNVLLSLRLVGLSSLILLPLTVMSFWIMKNMGWMTPAPVHLEGGAWTGWIVFQFLYVATSEELFFRGYLITRLERLFRTGRLNRISPWLCVVISAGLFALAHVIVQGSPTAALTFLPALALGWLFIRTRSLLAPILFHGIANVFYVLVQPAI